MLRVAVLTGLWGVTNTKDKRRKIKIKTMINKNVSKELNDGRLIKRSK